MQTTRRSFLLAGGGSLLAYAAPPADQVVLGVIGSGGRGTLVMTTFQKDLAVRVGAICDVYEPNLENALSVAAKTADTHPRPYRNYKELLADKNVHAVLIATPEHWHYQMVLDAIAAGKDVYVEKPLCQTPEQGAALVEAEKTTGRIIQVGMQRRSYDLYQEGRRIVAAGELGAVRMVRSWWLNNYLGSPVPTKLAGKLDWEQWQGPAARRDFDADRFRNWRLYSDYAGGILADQGAHVFDGIHMLMDAGYPLAVTAAAGKPHRAGVDMPESVVATAEYREDFIGVFSINYGAMPYRTRNDQLNQLDGDLGRVQRRTPDP
jgi:predicted dehydrogenase